MNSWSIMRSKMLSVMITLFFTGIIISGGILFLLTDAHPGDLSYQACIAIGTTYLTGILSISIARWSKEYVVIYREKPKEKLAKKLAEAHVTAGLLDLNALSNTLRESVGVQPWINAICSQLLAGQAAVYKVQGERIELTCGYALTGERILGTTYSTGEGLIGRVAVEGISMYINPLPEGYITIYSGLGSSSPRYLSILPIKTDNNIVGVLELATFSHLDIATRQQVEKASDQISSYLTTANHAYATKY